MIEGVRGVRCGCFVAVHTSGIDRSTAGSLTSADPTTQRTAQDAFEALDSHKAALGVETYGVSVTTLEEVFIRVTRGDEADADGRVAISVRRHSLEERRLSMELERRRSSLGGGGAVDFSQSGQQQQHKKKDDPFAAQGAEAPTGATGSPDGKGQGEKEQGVAAVDYRDHWTFFRRHMYALLVKRLLYFKRDRKAWAYQFVMPALFILAGCFLMRAGANSIFAEFQPPLTLGLAAFNPDIKVDPNPIPFNADGGPFDYQVCVRERVGARKG